MNKITWKSVVFNDIVFAGVGWSLFGMQIMVSCET